jgi:hypothetical protein
LTRFWQTRAVRQARHLASPDRWYRRFTAERRPLPQFVIAGAQKAGTTSLFDYLSGHPRCAPSLTKEVHFFDEHFSRGPRWYRTHFPLEAAADDSRARQAKSLCFESSPYYMFDPRVPARMRQVLPGVKVILLLRNPARRAYSHYQHSVRRGREPLAFEQALDAEPERLAGEHERLLAEPDYQSQAHRHFSYLARGVYVDQLCHWHAHFPAGQLLVIQAERMFRQPREVFGVVLGFLGLDAWLPAEFAAHNSGRYQAGMSSATRDRLARYFAPHNERLFELLGTRYDWR